jgi:hypothetical protein
MKHSLPLRAPSPECLSPETISAYVQRLLPAEEGGQVEKHMQNCDWCVHEVKAAFQIAFSLPSGKREPVPATLKARVAALWENQAAEEQPVSFSRLVIQFAKRGLRLLEKRLTLPLLDVQEVLVPVPVSRSEESLPALNLTLDAGQTEIRLTAAQEREGLALTMTLLSMEQKALAGQRVFLRQHGRSIFSAKTDSEGTLRIPRLEAGIYEVACPGIPVTFQLELRP